jgi:hypothetical protein
LSPHSGALCNRTCHQRTKARRGGSLAGPSCQSSAVGSPQAVFCLSVGRYEEESDDATSCRIRTLSTVREWARLPLMEMVRQFSCPRHARCTNQTLSRLLRCTLDFRVGSLTSFQACVSDFRSRPTSRHFVAAQAVTERFCSELGFVYAQFGQSGRDAHREGRLGVSVTIASLCLIQTR